MDLQIQQSVFARNTRGFNTHFWCCLYDHVGNAPRITAAVGFRGGSSDSAASPFSRLSLHLTFSFITDHQTRLEKRRNTRRAPRRNGEDRSAALKHTPFAHWSDTHTRCLRLSMRLSCTNMTASARRSWITFSRTLMTHNFLEEVQEEGRGCPDVARVRRYPVFLAESEAFAAIS